MKHPRPATPRCRLCHGRIEPHDFSMPTELGPVCSSCLAQGLTPRHEILRLFPAPAAPAAIQEMSLDDLRHDLRAALRAG
ncbi:MAG: hypothetical protein AB7D57_06870 [Desulfovibrionaceae bacterium]